MKKIKQKRKVKNVGIEKLLNRFGSSKDVYTRINCQQASFSRWKNGISKIPIHHSLKLIKLYGEGISLAELNPELPNDTKSLSTIIINYSARGGTDGRQ